MISCVSSAKRFTQRCTQREVQGLYYLMGLLAICGPVAHQGTPKNVRQLAAYL